MYLPEGGEVTLNTDGFASDLEAEWFNPRDGSRQGAESTDPDTFSAPDAEDWVLVFRP